MRSRPPRSTLFPYTTLFRSALTTDPSSAEAYNTLGSLYVRRGDWGRAREALSKAIDLEPKFASAHRSEEHTSELQSLRHLVCRLLLEKKKATSIFSVCSIPE